MTTSKRGTKLEKETMKEICEWLASHDYFFWRSNNVPVFASGRFRAMPKYTPKGLPDIIVVKRGKFIGIEVKREGFKKTEQQEKFQHDLEMHGGIYILAYHLSDVQNVINFV